MYGLYLEAVNDYINESYGEDVWRLIENRAEIPHLKFVRHQMYKYVGFWRNRCCCDGNHGNGTGDLLDTEELGIYVGTNRLKQPLNSRSNTPKLLT